MVTGVNRGQPGSTGGAMAATPRLTARTRGSREARSEELPSKGARRLADPPSAGLEQRRRPRRQEQSSSCGAGSPSMAIQIDGLVRLDRAQLQDETDPHEPQRAQPPVRTDAQSRGDARCGWDRAGIAPAHASGPSSAMIVERDRCVQSWHSVACAPACAAARATATSGA